MANPWYDPNGEGLCVWGAWQAERVLSFAESLVDRSGNGNDLVVGVAPDWNKKDGWTGDGLTQYLITSFIPQNDQSQTMIVQFSNVTLTWAGAYLAGVQVGAVPADRFGLRLQEFAPWSQDIVYENGGLVTIAPYMTEGSLAVAGNQGYRNGVADGAPIGAYSGVIDVPLYIFCHNRKGVGPEFFLPSSIQAVAIYDCILTAPQVASVTASMADLPQQPRTQPGRPRAARTSRPRTEDAGLILPDARDAGGRLPDARDAGLRLPDVQTAVLHQSDARAANPIVPDSRAADLALPDIGAADLLGAGLDAAGLRVPEPGAANALVPGTGAGTLLIPVVREGKEL